MKNTLTKKETDGLRLLWNKFPKDPHIFRLSKSPYSENEFIKIENSEGMTVKNRKWEWCISYHTDSIVGCNVWYSNQKEMPSIIRDYLRESFRIEFGC